MRSVIVLTLYIIPVSKCYSDVTLLHWQMPILMMFPRFTCYHSGYYKKRFFKVRYCADLIAILHLFFEEITLSKTRPAIEVAERTAAYFVSA